MTDPITHFQEKTKLVWLNNSNKTGELQLDYLDKIIEEVKTDIVACEIGCAYGGGVEAMARRLMGIGHVYGFDTFVGHPKDLADDIHDKEATCMEPWYSDQWFGTAGLDVDYQRKILKEEGLDNVTLVKGRVNEHSFDEIDKINFALIDLDLIKSTRSAYAGCKDKFVKGAYLFMHDAFPPEHLPMINEFVYSELLKSGDWKLERESVQGLLTILKRV